MSTKKFNLVLMILCMFFLLNQVSGILDSSLNDFGWISIAVNIVILMLLAQYNFNLKKKIQKNLKAL